jgi:hypothetical protein
LLLLPLPLSQSLLQNGDEEDGAAAVVAAAVARPRSSMDSDVMVVVRGWLLLMGWG